MLGEDHSLTIDFPEFKDLIEKLNQHDKKFSSRHERYSILDKEIQDLELRDAPIDDNTMNALKHERSQLKDSLYQQLLAEQ